LNLAETDNEESYTDKVRLITVDHPVGTRIAPDANGRIFSYSAPHIPLTAVDKNGSDILSLISTEDGIGSKVYNGDFADFDFGNRTIFNSAIFVLRAQGFLSDTTKGVMTAAVRPILTIQTQDERGAWIDRGIFYPRWESAVCAYDLSGAFPFSKIVRVIAASCQTNKYHQIDYVGLNVNERKTFTQVELSPLSAVHSNGADVSDKLAESDSDYAYMASNQKIFLSFKASKIPRRMVRDFIFVTDGYYVPMGTFFIYTWDGTAWAQRDGWSIDGSGDQVRTFDLSMWLPDPAGEYKARIWQDYFYESAAIDYVGLTRGATAGTMTSATDLRTNISIIDTLNKSDDIRHTWGVTSPNRNRWVEVKWNGLTINTPPTTNPVTITNPNSPTPTIGWTYIDVEGSPQAQYEVEVWTGPGATGTVMWDPAVGIGTATSVLYAGAALVNGQTYYARVKAFDATSWGAWSEVSWVANFGGSPPIAEAGPNRIVAARPACLATVTLDGTGSSGIITSYAWTGPFGGPLASPTPIVTLSIGVNKIFLVVANMYGSSKDSVLITVADSTAPVPNVTTLPTIRGQCSVTLTTPAATDNCAGSISGTTDSLSFTTQGTRTVVWTYSDGRGNTATQPQTVIVKDTIAPVSDSAALPTIRAQCSVTLTPPTATDNCVGRVIGATDSLSFTTQGTRTVVWTYSDGHGNTATQNQTVIVKDTIAPTITRGADTAVLISALDSGAFITVKSATAVDNCTQITMGAARSDGKPLDSLFPIGTTRIEWKACDANGNCGTANQNITVKRNHAPVLFATADTTIREKDSLRMVIFADDSDGTIPRITAGSILPAGCSMVDGGNGKAALAWNTGCNDHGDYAIKAKAFDGIDSVVRELKIRIQDVNFPPVFLSSGNQYALQSTLFSYTVRTQDCDGTASKLRAINLPSGALFADNGDGTGTMTWTPQKADVGYYMVIFEAKDELTAVRDTVIVIVQDANHFAPDLTVSTADTTVGINLPLAIFARATCLDGTTPQLLTGALPAGAKFSGDGEGNGIFSWTPRTAGTYSWTILARNAADSTLKTSRAVKITVENKNVTGPVFLPCRDTVINQGQSLTLTVEARDLDGAIPELYLVSAPPGVGFRDNGNGTGSFTWKPGCDAAGHFTVRAGATDHFLADSISVGIDVNIVNFPPVIAPIADRNAAPGELVAITVSATDPCIGAMVPMLSVSCDLPGYTFVTKGDGTGMFGWKAVYDTGSYPIIFYASNGFATAGRTVMLSIHKTGSLVITAQPPKARIHVMPSMNYSGTLLGTDSVSYCAPPGTYWFEIEAPGYRSVRTAFPIKADSVIVKKIVLKPAIPLMLTTPDSFEVDTNISSAAAGCFTFADVNGDGLVDLSVISGNGFKTCFGYNRGSDSGFQSIATDSAEVRTPVVAPVAHVFSDWNNTGTYKSIMSTASGVILLLKPSQGAFIIEDTLCMVPAGKSYPAVLDVNHDGKKDLVVHTEGKGIFVFPNTGTDSLPKLGSLREVTDTAAAPLTHFKGPLLFMDINQTGAYAWIVSSGGVLQMFTADSLASKLIYDSDLNCAGGRCLTDSARYGLIGPARGQPKLVVVKGRTLKAYSTRLCGDVNGDGAVDIRDIGKISKFWEVTDRDSTWVPLYNLKLGNGGNELIDIRDISRASKCWELKE